MSRMKCKQENLLFGTVAMMPRIAHDLLFWRWACIPFTLKTFWSFSRQKIIFQMSCFKVFFSNFLIRHNGHMADICSLLSGPKSTDLSSSNDIKLDISAKVSSNSCCVGSISTCLTVFEPVCSMHLSRQIFSSLLCSARLEMAVVEKRNWQFRSLNCLFLDSGDRFENSTWQAIVAYIANTRTFHNKKEFNFILYHDCLVKWTEVHACRR